MKKNNIGLYIHVPFCIQKCAYCDFYSLSGEYDIEGYANKLISDIKALSSIIGDKTVDTVFFGGGTPSLLGSDNFKRISDAVHNGLNIDPSAEFSVEVNPATVDNELSEAFKYCGVNRVSIGLQSSDERELSALSRIHNFNGFLSTFGLVKEKVTDNINVDLMYGIPNQNIATLERSLKDVLSLSPTHISVYGLKIEPHTPFGRMGDSLILPDEDVQAQMYTEICNILSSHGLMRYEISNFALKGYECRHNLKYWNREEYIGIGPSAYSFFNGARFSFGRDLNKYMNSDYQSLEGCLDEYRVLDDNDVYNERIMLGLRLECGIVPDSSVLDKANKYVKSGFMRYDGVRLSFTTKGFMVSNYILSELII